MRPPKILIVDTYYPEFLRRLYQQHPALTEADLLTYHFGTGDFYSRHLRTLGYNAQDCIANYQLRSVWSTYRTILQHVRSLRPDILYMQNLTVCDPVFLRYLKRSVKLVIGQIACPLPPRPYLKSFDLILTSFPHFVERIKRLGIACEYFRIGFEAELLQELPSHPEKIYDVVFVGGFSSVHQTGSSVLEALGQTVALDVWGYGTSPRYCRYHGEAWAMEMYQIIQQAKICINRHSSAAEDYANNMRLFETTGLGTFLITDDKKNLNDLFTVGQEVVSYRSADELIDRVRYYLAHPTEREAIAKAGQQRTLSEHTYRHRMVELDAILKRYL